MDLSGKLVRDVPIDELNKNFVDSNARPDYHDDYAGDVHDEVQGLALQYIFEHTA
jgi:hypothetical protein